jgi:XTP/dITP diphosphohydrolase
MNIVLATRNKKKIEEIKRIVRDVPVTIYTLDDFPGCPEVEEDGKTFEENAVKKASAVSKYTKMPTLADDSGLEVYALGGAPGVFSARYAGREADDRKNYEKLLREMSSVPDGERGGRFVCVIALALPVGDSTLRDSRVETFSGYAEGMIGKEPKGANGFGYDPVFYATGHERTFAEMSDKEKDLLSHRGMALRRLYAFLKNSL